MIKGRNVMAPSISIIVPVYKVEKYLRKCVDSILCQSFSDFELILVDDGSPDNCPAICDEYANIDERIIVIHQENRGLSASRNAGLQIAKGKYICFVDSDDILHPQYCAILIKGIQKNDCLLCACNVQRFSEILEPTEIFKENDCVYTTYNFEEFLIMQMSQTKEMGVWNRIYSRSIFDSIHFTEGKLHEDIIFAADLLDSNIANIALIELPLYYYRQRHDSIVSSQSVNRRCSPDRVFAGSYLYSKAKEHNFEHLDKCFQYALSHPWSFVDPIYVSKKFKTNRTFMKALRLLMQQNKSSVLSNPYFPNIIKKRMILFSKSRFLYGLNAYARLFRVYLYRILKKDAYSDGHGI